MSQTENMTTSTSTPQRITDIKSPEAIQIVSDYLTDLNDKRLNEELPAIKSFSEFAIGEIMIGYTQEYGDTLTPGEVISEITDSEYDNLAYRNTSVGLWCLELGLLKNEDTIAYLQERGGARYYKDNDRMQDYILHWDFIQIAKTIMF